MNAHETTPPQAPVPRSYRLTFVRLMAIGCIFLGASLENHAKGGAVATLKLPLTE